MAEYAVAHDSIPVHCVAVEHLRVTQMLAQMKRAYLRIQLSLLSDFPLQVISTSRMPTRETGQ